MKTEEARDRREFITDLCRLLIAAPLVVAAGSAAVADQSAAPQTKVIAAKCTGCGKCVRVATKTFAVNAQTRKAYVKNPTGDPVPIIRKAARVCPTKAIVAP
ncbi:MAG: ferredoxin [Acidobacteriota bacterium]|jgi:ferredoxin|nr:ferredoxin [Acidobacteriota bacterium]